MKTNKDNFLEINNLFIKFKTNNGNDIYAVNDASLKINKGVINGIIGESGSGKSTIAFSIVNLLPKNGQITAGSIKFNGKELTHLTNKQLEEIRGNEICFIPQNPMSSLDPFYTIGNQIKEVVVKKNKLKLKKYIETHNDVNDIKREIQEFKKKSKFIKDQIIDFLKLVNIHKPEEVIKKYPKELSGGMLQRIIIAMSLIAEPDLLIADEPTTALDVTVQLQILELIKNIQKKTKMSVIFITHDLGVVAKICDYVNVMYAGNVVESGDVNEIFYNPKHEYTKSLIRSMPKLDKSDFIPIKGNPIDMSQLPIGCPFQPRCDAYLKICLEKNIKKFEIHDQHETSCFKYLFESLKNKEISQKQFDNAINNQILPIKEKDYLDVIKKYEIYLQEPTKKTFYEYKKIENEVNLTYKQKNIEHNEKEFLIKTDIYNNVNEIKKKIKYEIKNNKKFFLDKTKLFNYLSNLKISNLIFDKKDLFFSANNYFLIKQEYEKYKNCICELKKEYKLKKNNLKKIKKQEYEKYKNCICELKKEYKLKKKKFEYELKKKKFECKINKSSYEIIKIMRENMFKLQKYIIKIAINIKKYEQKNIIVNKAILNKNIKIAYKDFIEQKNVIKQLENSDKITLNQMELEITKLNQLYINYLNQMYE